MNENDNDESKDKIWNNLTSYSASWLNRLDYLLSLLSCNGKATKAVDYGKKDKLLLL